MVAVSPPDSGENTCVLRGRVLLVRVDTGYRTVAQVNDMEAVMHQEMKRLPSGERCVVAADWRAVPIFSPETADRIQQMFRAISVYISRSGVLTARENALGSLQANRIISESVDGNRRRRFTAPLLMLEFLSESMTVPEVSTPRLPQLVSRAPAVW